MGVKMSGFDELQGLFRRVERKAIRAATAELHHQGELIKDASQALAPVDKANLEESHAVETERQPNAATTTISVGGTVNGVNVDDYLDLIHYGSYNLGPKSAEKASTTGQPVGPEFLKRGFDKQEPEIADAIGDAIVKAFE